MLSYPRTCMRKSSSLVIKNSSFEPYSLFWTEGSWKWGGVAQIQYVEDTSFGMNPEVTSLLCFVLQCLCQDGHNNTYTDLTFKHYRNVLISLLGYSGFCSHVFYKCSPHCILNFCCFFVQFKKHKRGSCSIGGTVA